MNCAGFYDRSGFIGEFTAEKQQNTNKRTLETQRVWTEARQDSKSCWIKVGHLCFNDQNNVLFITEPLSSTTAEIGDALS